MEVLLLSPGCCLFTYGEKRLKNFRWASCGLRRGQWYTIQFAQRSCVLCMPLPWRHSRPRWIGPWEAWSDGWQTSQRWGVGIGLAWNGHKPFYNYTIKKKKKKIILQWTCSTLHADTKREDLVFPCILQKQPAVPSHLFLWMQSY